MATVLIVDDKEMMRDSLSLALSRAGHKAVTTGDPSEAVALVRQHRPACVITDLKMPKMDGIEATSRIKAEQPGTLIVGLSLTQSSQVEPLLLQAGASCYVTKEAAVDRLYEAIIAAVKRETKSGDS